jgi:hypothetical protein
MDRPWLRALLSACALAFAMTLASAALAERRVALVVGNAKYQNADTLANTINDANAVAAMLTRAGFDVVDERRDVGVVEFKRAVRDFLNAASTADIAVVYYSGHGFEIGGVNYLIPVDAKLAMESDVDDETVPLDRLIQATQGAKRLSLIILDACRDNPFLRAATRVAAKRSISNRIIGIEPTGGDTLIAYAAKAGSVSYDGLGPNSPFTTALVKYLPIPGLDVRIALGKVRDDVLASTGNLQEPFVYGSLGGGVAPLVPAPVAGPASDADASAAREYSAAERMGSRDAWLAFLGAHATGFYANMARAQLARLAGSAAPAVASTLPPPSAPAAAPRPPAKDGAAQAPAPQIVAALGEPKSTPEQICKDDDARLTKLRGDPSVEAASALARDLGCEDLRPQVNRLLESLGVTATAQSPTKAASLKPIEDAAECQRENDELIRLRANPERDAALRFAHDLKCEALRTQTARLLESVGQ